MLLRNYRIPSRTAVYVRTRLIIIKSVIYLHTERGRERERDRDKKTKYQLEVRTRVYV